jgi:hypothetical protein
MRRITIVFAVLLMLLAAIPASAQKLSEILPDLLLDTVRLAPPGPGFPSHEAHFQPTPQDPVFSAVNQFNAAIVIALSTFPLGSSSGGFAFEGDPALGDFRPASRSFGPTFAERALTIGRRNFSVGFNYYAARYDDFEGKELDSGDINFFIRHVDIPPPGEPNPFFESDLIKTSVALNLKTDVSAFLFNYGVTSRWDVGAVVPITRVGLDATVTAAVQRLATSNIPGLHHFAGTDPNERVQSVSESATGLGDIVLRTKYRVLKTQGGGVAGGLDLRLPTGDEEDLLGTGATQARFIGIASTEFNRFAPHVNLSFTASGNSSLTNVDLPNEFGYVMGFEVPFRRVTAAFDVVGRRLLDSGRFEDRASDFPVRLPNGQQQTVSLTQFTPVGGSANIVFGAAGLKVLVAQHLLLNANVVFKMNDNWLQDNASLVVGFDYVFPRQ